MADRETRCPAGRNVVLNVDRFDARAGRAAAERRFHAVDGLPIAFQPHFDVAVRPVAHPPVYAFDAGALFGEEPEPDALHASAYQYASRYEHGTRNYGLESC